MRVALVGVSAYAHAVFRQVRLQKLQLWLLANRLQQTPTLTLLTCLIVGVIFFSLPECELLQVIQ